MKITTPLLFSTVVGSSEGASIISDAKRLRNHKVYKSAKAKSIPHGISRRILQTGEGFMQDEEEYLDMGGTVVSMSQSINFNPELGAGPTITVAEGGDTDLTLDGSSSTEDSMASTTSVSTPEVIYLPDEQQSDIISSIPVKPEEENDNSSMIYEGENDEEEDLQGEAGISPDSLSCPETLTNVNTLDDKTVMYYAIVPSNPPSAKNGILCARLEVQSDQGWLGFGISTDGKMTGSQAVIGLPSDSGLAEDGDVKKYDLNGGDPRIKVMEDSRQTLIHSSITQDVDAGMTVMSFTKLLVEDDESEIPIAENGENIFLFAKGTWNWPSYHEKRMSFPLDFGYKAVVLDDEEVYDPFLGVGGSGMSMSMGMNEISDPWTEDSADTEVEGDAGGEIEPIESNDPNNEVSEEECVEDGGIVSMSLYKDGTDEQNDIEDLELKCCIMTLSESSCTSAISMDENGNEMPPAGSCEGICGPPPPSTENEDTSNTFDDINIEDAFPDSEPESAATEVPPPLDDMPLAGASDTDIIVNPSVDNPGIEFTENEVDPSPATGIEDNASSSMAKGISYLFVSISFALFGVL